MLKRKRLGLLLLVLLALIILSLARHSRQIEKPPSSLDLKIPNTASQPTIAASETTREEHAGAIPHTAPSSAQILLSTNPIRRFQQSGVNDPKRVPRQAGPDTQASAREHFPDAPEEFNRATGTNTKPHCHPESPLSDAILLTTLPANTIFEVERMMPFRAWTYDYYVAKGTSSAFSGFVAEWAIPEFLSHPTSDPRFNGRIGEYDNATTCLITLNGISKQDRSVMPASHLILAKILRPIDENGNELSFRDGIVFLLSSNEVIRAISCKAPASADSSALTIRDLKEAFGDRIDVCPQRAKTAQIPRH